MDNIAIETFVNVITHEEYDVVVASYQKIPKHEICSNRIGKNELFGSEIYKCYYSNKIVVTAWNKLIRKDFLIKNNLFFEKGIIHEDIIWSFLVMSKAKSLYSIDKPTYLYRIREDSIMTKNFGEKNIGSYKRILDVMSLQNDIMLVPSAREFYYKKCLEFTLKIYALKGIQCYKSFVESINPFNKRVKSTSVASIIIHLITIAPRAFSILIMKLFLNTKFTYLKT